MDKEILSTIITLAKEVGVLQNSNAELDHYNESIRHKLDELKKENDFLHNEIKNIKDQFETEHVKTFDKINLPLHSE